MQRELSKLTWVRVKELVPYEIDTIILPVGTVEAHGAAALGTDNYIPESIAGHLAEKINALIAPTVNYGITRSLYGYPGSLTISPESFEKYIRDILDSLADVGFEQVILINGHGGNNDVLKSVAQSYFYDTEVKIAVIHWWELCENVTREVYGQDGGHAGINETAMVLALDESLADQSVYDKGMAYTYDPGADVFPIPGSIILYSKDEGYPDFNMDKAKEFQKAVFARIEEFVINTLKQWAKI
jgi:creatinine amidohydrolase